MAIEHHVNHDSSKQQSFPSLRSEADAAAAAAAAAVITCAKHKQTHGLHPRFLAESSHHAIKTTRSRKRNGARTPTQDARAPAELYFMNQGQAGRLKALLAGVLVAFILPRARRLIVVAASGHWRLLPSLDSNEEQQTRPTQQTVTLCPASSIIYRPQNTTSTAQAKTLSMAEQTYKQDRHGDVDQALWVFDWSKRLGKEEAIEQLAGLGLFGKPFPLSYMYIIGEQDLTSYHA
jgi:hypothetical protein